MADIGPSVQGHKFSLPPFKAKGIKPFDNPSSTLGKSWIREIREILRPWNACDHGPAMRQRLEYTKENLGNYF